MFVPPKMGKYSDPDPDPKFVECLFMFGIGEAWGVLLSRYVEPLALYDNTMQDLVRRNIAVESDDHLNHHHLNETSSESASSEFIYQSLQNDFCDSPII